MKKTSFIIICYTLSFFIVWTLYELFLKPKIITSEPLGELIRSLIKIVVWIIPCVCLLKKNTNVYIPLDSLFTNKIKWFKALPLFLFFTLFLLGGSYFQYGDIAIRNTFQMKDLIGTFLLVGITEEFVFRGWLLNVFLEKMNMWLAVFLNAFLFLAIHFPVWIQTRVFIENIVSGSFMQIVILSGIFSFAFIKSKNLLLPIALHMYWKLLTILFY